MPVKISPRLREAHKLFLEGSVALSATESNGIRIDVDYLDRAVEKTRNTIRKLEDRMRADKVYRHWRKRYGDRAKLGSREQLGQVLFEDLGHPVRERTATGRPKVDGTALDHVDLPFVTDFRRVERLKKAVSTNLLGIKREVVGEFLHANFNLASGGSDEDAGGARTYRGSADSPNFQNFPGREDELAELVRRCFIPRDGHQLGEFDFKLVEVSVAACYNHDPVLIDYVKDKTKDMHRDRAMDCFFLGKEEVSKKARHVAKNKFVFPQFYGSFYVDCARSMWEEMERLKLKVEGSDELLRDRLRKNGVKSLGDCDPERKPRPGTFEHHVKGIEDHFWGKVFKVYAKWKKDFYNDYLRRGYFDMHTGFRVSGYYRRNQVVNYPVQGAAFHCLLWCLIRLQKWLTRKGMRTLILGQIHDSLLLDIYRPERDEVVEKLLRIMREDLPRHWDWIIVPLDVEIELSPPGGSWYEKAPYELPA